MLAMYLWAKLIKKARGSAIIDSQIHNTSKINSGSHVVNSNIAKYSYCAFNSTILNCDIGSFCSIGNNVSIGAPMHPMNWVSTSPVFINCKSSPKKRFSKHKIDLPLRTIIKNDVWIGEKVLIKQGVTIGNGVIIGMGSIVTKDVEDYSVVAGCPARLIRKRFPENIVKDFLEIEWWNLPDNIISNLSPLIVDPTRFIEKVQELV